MRDLGAVWLDDGKCRLKVWAPRAAHVELHIVYPEEQTIAMKSDDRGYHSAILDHLQPGTRYRYRLGDGREFPDPASAFQPEGVHGPSEIISNDFAWSDDNWHGIPIENYIIYELHVGTFTPQGTIDDIIPRLDTLRDLGITALELMPLAQFPGHRNWGYDGVFPFAVHNSYGGPESLKRLVDACHARELAVILDVVYNHLGPEGNYLNQFGHYFTDRYKTPWGWAINYDAADSDEVRHYVIENALFWITQFHIDALRLDAVHAILDHSAENILEELARAVRETGKVLNRQIYTIAESALNDTRLIRPTELGGYGLDAQWNDDFHHSLHTLLTKECEGYYVDFGQFQHMAQALSEGFVYAGRYSVNRRRRHGNSSREIPSAKFVVYAQNHDQIGNRIMGDRLSQLVSFEYYKLATAAVLLSPFIPLLFMGDEYGEPAPFQYFVSHSDEHLIESVRRGRKDEFIHFKWREEPPDPQAPSTFERSKLRYELSDVGQHRVLFEFHRELIRLRRATSALSYLSKQQMDVLALESDQVLLVRRWHGSSEVLTILNFNSGPVRLVGNVPNGTWQKLLDSSAEQWLGPGSQLIDRFDSRLTDALTLSPASAVVLERLIEN